MTAIYEGNTRHREIGDLLNGKGNRLTASLAVALEEVPVAGHANDPGLQDDHRLAAVRAVPHQRCLRGWIKRPRRRCARSSPRIHGLAEHSLPSSMRAKDCPARCSRLSGLSSKVASPSQRVTARSRRSAGTVM